MAKHVIKIFLASSIVELATERLMLSDFIRNISDDFEVRYDIKIMPLRCENLDDAVSAVRKQEEYNEKIRDSQLCFFIFFTKAGQYTVEEFEVARQQFLATGNPRIYTYFKNLRGETAEQSLIDFMEMLDKTLGHYYGTFDHIDTVKLRILLSIKLQEMNFLEVKTDGGHCFVDGKKVLPLHNVVEFANNRELSRLQGERASIEKEYLQLKPIYEKGNCDNTFYSHYSGVASKRQSLIDEIEQLQKMIFSVSLQMVNDELRGEITLRQKEAYRLFELGDYQGCMAVLDAAQIDDEFEREEKLDQERRIARRKRYIREYKTKIDILSVMTDYAERFTEITQCYEKIVPYAMNDRIELTIVYDYIAFRDSQNRNPTDLAEQLLPLYEKAEDILKEDIAHLYNLMGVVYTKQNQPINAEKFHLKAIAVYEVLAKENPECFSINLATSYNNAGVFYKNLRNYPLSMDCFQKAINILENMPSENTNLYSAYLSGIYNNIGQLFTDQKLEQQAEESFIASIEIRAQLSAQNPERYMTDLAGSYNNIGLFYMDQKNPQKATEFLQKAIAIEEQLSAMNPDQFDPNLATCYNNIAILYNNQECFHIAEECFIKAITIRERLSAQNPERFTQLLIASYKNIALFYSNQERTAEAEKYYAKVHSFQNENYNHSDHFRIGYPVNGMVFDGTGIDDMMGLHTAPKTRNRDPYLIRIQNNEKISINRPVFRIGREKAFVDYCIEGNLAIAKCHAMILCNNGQFFIINNNSESYVYVNDIRIQSGFQIKLFSTDKIRFADEEFEFRTQ